MASPKSPNVIAKHLVQQQLQDLKDEIIGKVAQKFSNRESLIAEMQAAGFDDANSYNDKDWAKIQQAITLTEMYNAGLTAASAFIATNTTEPTFIRIKRKYPYCAWYWKQATSSNGRIFDKSERARKFRAICKSFANGENLEYLLIYHGISLRTFQKWRDNAHFASIWEDANLQLRRRQIAAAKEDALRIIHENAIKGTTKSVERTVVVSRIKADGTSTPHTKYQHSETFQLNTDLKAAELLIKLDEDGKLASNKTKEDASANIESSNLENDEIAKARLEVLQEKTQKAEAYKQSIATLEDDNYKKFVNPSSTIHQPENSDNLQQNEAKDTLGKDAVSNQSKDTTNVSKTMTKSVSSTSSANTILVKPK